MDLISGVWDIPPEETKTGKKSGVGLIVPLTPMVAQTIKALPEELKNNQWVFPGAREGQPYSLGGISTALRKALNEHSTIDHFTPRDLRRTVTTHMSRLGILAEIRNRIQDHAIAGDVESKHYNRHDYLPEKRAALEKWEREVQRIIGEGTESNVVELRA